jgi:hypothetical protein
MRGGRDVSTTKLRVSAPAARNCSRHFLSRLSAMSCSRHSSVIVFGPRSQASTISVFCCAVNLAVLLSLAQLRLLVVERPILDSEPDRSTARFAGVPLSNQDPGKFQRLHGVHARGGGASITLRATSARFLNRKAPARARNPTRASPPSRQETPKCCPFRLGSGQRNGSLARSLSPPDLGLTGSSAGA